MSMGAAGRHRDPGRLRRLLRWLAGGRRAGRDLTPTGPPIEQLAHDLRRLLWRHEQLSRSRDPVHARWLKPLEAAISSPAIKAARALQLPHQDPPPYNGLDTEELRRLLRALAAEGLVLPGEVRLLAPGGRH
jgi:CRP-like cAMP-binding protein